MSPRLNCGNQKPTLKPPTPFKVFFNGPSELSCVHVLFLPVSTLGCAVSELVSTRRRNAVAECVGCEFVEGLRGTDCRWPRPIGRLAAVGIGPAKENEPNTGARSLGHQGGTRNMPGPLRLSPRRCCVAWLFHLPHAGRPPGVGLPVNPPDAGDWRDQAPSGPPQSIPCGPRTSLQTGVAPDCAPYVSPSGHVTMGSSGSIITPSILTPDGWQHRVGMSASGKLSPICRPTPESDR